MLVLALIVLPDSRSSPALVFPASRSSPALIFHIALSKTRYALSLTEDDLLLPSVVLEGSLQCFLFTVLSLLAPSDI